MGMCLEEDASGRDLKLRKRNFQLELHLVDLERIGVVHDVKSRGFPVRDRPSHKKLVLRNLVDLRFVIAGVNEVETLVVGEQ